MGRGWVTLSVPILCVLVHCEKRFAKYLAQPILDASANERPPDRTLTGTTIMLLISQ